MDSFYVILPSNTEDVEGNTTSKFTVRMPDTLELDSSWTVALSNIIYPFSFTLFGDSEEKESITVFRRYKEKLKSIQIEIPDLSFASAEAIEDSINAILVDVMYKELDLERKYEENEEIKNEIYNQGSWRKRREAEIKIDELDNLKDEEPPKGLTGYINNLFSTKAQHPIAEKLESFQKSDVKKLYSAQTQPISDEINEDLSYVNFDKIDFSRYEYPPEYKKMLLTYSKLQLADPSIQWVSIHYDKIHNRFYVVLQGNVEYIQLSRQLAYTLGFNSDKIYNGQVAKYMPDISGGVRHFLVYAPRLVENSIIGNVTAPLLRVVNVGGKPGESVSEVYMTEHHHRLLGKRHPDITIEIRTLTGKLIKFHWGTCILTLHFQRSLF